MAVETYKGNPNLKTAAVPHEFTPEQVKEFMKCSKDPVYFIQQYVKIVSMLQYLLIKRQRRETCYQDSSWPMNICLVGCRWV